MNKVFDAYAAYYDLLYQEKDYGGESEYVYRLLSNNGIAGGSVLDLGCGTGRHAEHLARMGFLVHGVDISPNMIATANARKCHDIADRLTFEVGDVRSVKKDCNYDAVISLFHVASYQIANEDLQSMFKTASTLLKKDGIFLFDFWYGPAVLVDLPNIRIKRMQGDGFRVLRIAEPTLHPNENVVDVNYTMLVTQNDNKRIEIIEEKHPMRYLFLPEIKNFLKIVGMEFLSSHTWLSETDLDFQSWQGVVLSKKQ